MAYSTNPNLPKARAIAMQLLVREGVALSVVANRCGVHRSTIWRWKRKWNVLNQHVQFTNDSRPSRQAGSVFRFTPCTWRIPTLASRPRTSPKAIAAQIVARVLELRRTLKRCAEVVWYYATTREGLSVSLSSVRRILRRHHCFDGARKKRVRPDNPRRPHVTKPGELVQTDTVHYICPLTKHRRYVYTVIDLHTRMAYAEVHSRILPGLAASVVLRASQQFGFGFELIQADNGPEFGRYFAQRLASRNITVRHSRLGRPNDNAHIERFNRTVQEECLGNRLTYKTTNRVVQARLTAYLDYYNHERVHLGLQLRTPAEMLQRF
ncbi:MAG TPA: DDE-type integrase/transposase/recombinase [Candidatus Saccharimonadales bacterium]